MHPVEENKLREMLIKIYSAHIDGKLTRELRILAGDLYSKYLNAEPLIDKTLYEAIGPLDGIAWPEIIKKTERPALSKERAKEILRKLQKG